MERLGTKYMRRGGRYLELVISDGHCDLRAANGAMIASGLSRQEMIRLIDALREEAWEIGYELDSRSGPMARGTMAGEDEAGQAPAGTGTATEVDE